MFVIESYQLAIFFCFITMLCWGSWANTQKLAGKEWPFQLFYWDYVLGIFFAALLLAFTLGSMGIVGRSFTDDLMQAGMPQLLSSFGAGVIFNFANLLLVIAINMAGMATAFPIGIGIALVQGVVLNYLLKPEGDPRLIFGGVVLVVLAILLDAIAYRKISVTEKKNASKGIIISLLAGLSMGLFYRYIADAMATDFVHPEIGKLTPYSAFFVFAGGVLVSNVLFNTIIMVRPISGTPVTYKAYFTNGSIRIHGIGMLGGLIWGVGMLLNIIASDVASPAIAYGLGQGATMVAALWGVFIWKEFKNGPKGTNWLLGFMFFCFVLGLFLLIAAK